MWGVLRAIDVTAGYSLEQPKAGPGGQNHHVEDPSHNYSNDAEKLHLRNDLLMTIGAQVTGSVAKMVPSQMG